MDITNRNFLEQYPFIQKSVSEADLITFDFEFSGLSATLKGQTSEFDSDEVRYQKLRETCIAMHAFQIGLCTFHYDAEKKSYVARPFNIFLYPLSDNHIDPKGDSNRILTQHPSAIRFNLRSGFNFNRLYRMGINYRCISTDREIIRRLCEHRVSGQMKHEELTGVERRALRKYEPPEQADVRLVMGNDIKENQEEALKKEAEAVKEWITTGEDEHKAKFDSLIFVRCLNDYLKDNEIVSLKDYKMSIDKNKKEITITRNAKVQKVAEGDAAKMPQTEETTANKENKDPKGTNPESNQMAIDASQMIIDKAENSKSSNTTADTGKVTTNAQIVKVGTQPDEKTVEQKPAPLTYEQRVEQMYLQEMGFSAIVEDMLKVFKSDKCVPLVAHNCQFDLLFFYQQFIGQLPETLKEFQVEWSKQIPTTFDNKLLSQARSDESEIFPSQTHLNIIYEALSVTDKFKQYDQAIVNALEKGVGVCFDEKNQMDKYSKPPPEKQNQRQSRASKGPDGKGTDSKESKSAKHHKSEDQKLADQVENELDKIISENNSEVINEPVKKDEKSSQAQKSQKSQNDTKMADQQSQNEGSKKKSAKGSKFSKNAVDDSGQKAPPKEGSPTEQKPADNPYHEAGFDAYITGYSFIKLLSIERHLLKCKDMSEDQTASEEVSKEPVEITFNKVMERFANRIPIQLSDNSRCFHLDPKAVQEQVGPHVKNNVFLSFTKDFRLKLNNKLAAGDVDFGGMSIDFVLNLIKNNVPLLQKYNFEIVRHRLFKEEIDERFILKIEDGENNLAELKTIVDQIKANLEEKVSQLGEFKDCKDLVTSGVLETY